MKKKASIGTRIVILFVISGVLLTSLGLGVSGYIWLQLTQDECFEDATLMSGYLTEDISVMGDRNKKDEIASQRFKDRMTKTVNTASSLIKINMIYTDGAQTDILSSSVELTGKKKSLDSENVLSAKELCFLNDNAFETQQIYGGFLKNSDNKDVLAVFVPIHENGKETKYFMEFQYSVSDLLLGVEEHLPLPLTILIGLMLILTLNMDLFIRKKMRVPCTELTTIVKNYMSSGFDEHMKRDLEKMSLPKYREPEEIRQALITMNDNVEKYVSTMKNIFFESEHDAMTMLHNRVKFQRRTVDSYPYMDSIYVAYLDINNLKDINETYGRSAGDAVIQKLAEKLRMITSDRIHTYRWGGDEFLIVMCNYDEEEANSFVGSWHERIGRLNRASDPIQCTVAYGTAFASGEFMMDTIVELADDAMYRTKTRQKREERRKKAKENVSIE